LDLAGGQRPDYRRDSATPIGPPNCALTAPKFDAKTNPAPYVGKYTLLIPGSHGPQR